MSWIQSVTYRETRLQCLKEEAFPLLGVYPREMKKYHHTKTFTHMFIATLFIIAKGENNPKSINWWIDEHKCDIIYAMEYFSHQKEWSIDRYYSTDKLWKCYAKWKRQDIRAHVVWFHFHQMSRIGISIEMTVASQVTPVVKNLPVKAGDIRDVSSIPGLGRSPGGEHGNPLQYSLENPLDRGGW